MRKSNGVMKELNKLYPDKIVSNLKMMNEELYKNLSEYAKEAKKTLKTFLEEMGYQYVRKPIGQMFT